MKTLPAAARNGVRIGQSHGTRPMRAMIAIKRLGVAGALVFGAALSASAQQVGTGPSETVPLSVCLIPLGAAGTGGVPGAGVDPNVPNAVLGTGTNHCSFAKSTGATRSILLDCEDMLVNYTGGQFQGTVPCDVLDCATDQLVRVTGTVKVSGSGNVKLDCDFKGN